MNISETRLQIALSVILFLIALSAFAGSIGLLTATDGSNLGFDLEMLEGSPFNDYLVPGLILGLVVGGSNLIGSVLLWQKHRFAHELAFAAGAVLFGWITVQVLIINDIVFLHWLYWTFSLFTMSAAIRLWFLNNKIRPTGTSRRLGGTR